MKSLKLILAAIAICAMSFSNLDAQDNSHSYGTGIGVRFGGLTSGIDVKHFISGNSALEGVVGFSPGSFLITGLYERQQDIRNAGGLQWYYGIGAHVGFFNYGARYYYYDAGRRYAVAYGSTATVVGLDFILGLEYKFSEAPFSIGVDTKPFIDFNTFGGVFWDGALLVRYTF